MKPEKINWLYIRNPGDWKTKIEIAYQENKIPRRRTGQRIYRDDDTFQCHVCNDGKEWKLWDIRDHFKESHPGKNPRFRKKFKQNTIQCHNCEICDQDFASLNDLDEHLNLHEDQYVCETCDAKFKKIVDFTLHVYKHNKEKIFQCQICDYSTKRMSSIVGHLGNTHKKNTKYKCDECGKRFATLLWYQEHQNIHTNAHPYSCEICEKKFPSIQNLYYHKNTVHKELLDVVLFKCDLCNKEYKHKRSLTLHMVVHTGKRAICEICGKQLTCKEKLKYHMRVHTGYKPFKCSQCDKTFSVKGRLIEHERTHTGERPYACRYCKKGFTQRGSRTIHERMHTGEKPYVCQFCNKGFVSKNTLDIHKKNCKGLA